MEDWFINLSLEKFFPMLESSIKSTEGNMFILLPWELPMLFTKKVVGNWFITLSLEKFSLYMDIMATRVLEDLLVMLALMVVSKYCISCLTITSYS